MVCQALKLFHYFVLYLFSLVKVQRIINSGVGTSGKAPRSIEAISATSLLNIIKATSLRPPSRPFQSGNSEISFSCSKWFEAHQI